MSEHAPELEPVSLDRLREEYLQCLLAPDARRARWQNEDALARDVPH